MSGIFVDSDWFNSLIFLLTPGNRNNSKARKISKKGMNVFKLENRTIVAETLLILYP
jgi:hypothetical protein